LFKILPYSSPPPKSIKLERVFNYEGKVIADITKIPKLWGCLESRDKLGGERVHWKLEFLGRIFWVEVGRVEERMSVGVRCEGERALGEKVLD
jgi:hypothetical protein